MFDRPAPSLLIAEARSALDAGVAAGFPQKVVANALGIAQRQLEMGPALEEAELRRLASLIGRTGNLDELNAALADRVRRGTLDVEASALIEHLILTTIAKLEIDQPAYPAFKAWREGA
jgi:hypothetical protein